VIPLDVVLALVVLVLLFGTIIGLVYWARGAPPHDDGTGGLYRDYLPRPVDDEAEGWAEPATRLPSKLPGDELRGRPKARPTGADGADGSEGGSQP
jgi:hypothetical protein